MGRRSTNLEVSRSWTNTSTLCTARFSTRRGTTETTSEPAPAPPHPRAREALPRQHIPTHVCCCSAIFVSFGGLLMKLKGEPQHLSKLVLDSRIYLLMRKARDD